MSNGGNDPLARSEWRNFWFLPLVAALGNSATVLHIYSIGPFMRPLQVEFGWGRAEVSAGITVANCGAILLYALIGVLIDRWGPRRVGLIGVTIMTSAVALLGTATGSMVNWLALWLVVMVGAVAVQPTIWTNAVASRFDRSRGLAIAVTLAGSGLSSTLLPLVATWLIQQFGWRAGFYGLGILWAILLLPAIFFFFHSATDDKKSGVSTENLRGIDLRQALRTSSFYKLFTAGGLLAFCLIGLVVHFVPILTDKGITSINAAAVAGIVGISSIFGRVITGVLLDRFRGDRVAAISFLLPILPCALLMFAPSTIFTFSVAAFLIGFSVGSELDSVVYLSTRHFGLKHFGVLFGAVLTASTLGTGLGPIVAGRIFDSFQSYDPFLACILPLMLLGALSMAFLGPYPDFETSAS